MLRVQQRRKRSRIRRMQQRQPHLFPHLSNHLDRRPSLLLLTLMLLLLILFVTCTASFPCLGESHINPTKVSFLVSIKGGADETQQHGRRREVEKYDLSGATKFPLAGTTPDPFVIIAPLIIGVVCEDGVLLMALHTGHTGTNEYDGDENYLRWGGGDEEKKTDNGTNSPFHPSSIDVPRNYRGPFRIHVLHNQVKTSSDGLGSNQVDGGCSVGMVNAGWRSDGEVLAKIFGQDLMKAENEMFGPIPAGNDHAFGLGHYISTKLSSQMAHQAVYSSGKRQFSCVSLIASASSGQIDDNADDDIDKEEAQSSGTCNGFLWLVDIAGIYQVRAHAIGGGLIESSSAQADPPTTTESTGSQPNASTKTPLANLVNAYLLEHDWTNISCEHAARDLLEFLFWNAADFDHNLTSSAGDTVEELENKIPSSGMQNKHKSWSVPRGTKVELAVMGTNPKRPFKRVFASTLFENNMKGEKPQIVSSQPHELPRGGDESDETIGIDPDVLSKQEAASSPRLDASDTVESVLNEAYKKLDSLESSMQSLTLEPSSSDQMPLLDFGRQANDVLTVSNRRLVVAERSKILPTPLCRSILKGIVSKVHVLYGDHLRSLRNYYGYRYELVLSKSKSSLSESSTRDTAERTNAEAAQRLIQEFQVAAKSSIPSMILSLDDNNDNDNLNNSIKPRILLDSHDEVMSMFDFSPDLQGLIQDMIDATEQVQDDNDIAELALSIMDNDKEKLDDRSSGGNRRRSRFIPKITIPGWMERVAARAFVFGVNYLQGWLAWQGIKRAALDRDKRQPKFPLF